MPSWSRTSLALAAFAAFATAQGHAQPKDNFLAPHRAVYDLSLIKSTGGSAPVAASGRIAYDFSGSACDGWTVAFRQFTELTPAEGEPKASDMRSTTFESGDHNTLRFRVESLDDGRVTRTVDGAAERSGDGALSLDLRQPEPKKADLGRDVIFPTDMMLRALKAARAGEAMLAVKVFDGSDGGDKVYHTLSVIGRPQEGALDDATKNEPSMKDMRRWRVTVSYFDVAKVDAPPVYLLSFHMWDNGVSSDLVIDYGDFQLRGAMSKLEMLPVKPCPR